MQHQKKFGEFVIFLWSSQNISTLNRTNWILNYGIFRLRFFNIKQNHQIKNSLSILIDLKVMMLPFDISYMIRKLRARLPESHDIPQYMYQDSKVLCMLSTLLNQLKLVYRQFGQSNIHSTLDFSLRPASKETNLPLHIKRR